MKELIKLSDTHYIVVDDSKIQVLDWCFDTNTNLIFQYYTQRELKDTDKKITHSTIYEFRSPNLRKYVSPISLSEVKELIGEREFIDNKIELK